MRIGTCSWITVIWVISWPPDSALSSAGAGSMLASVLWRFLPPIGMLLLIGVGLGVRPWLQLRRHGSAGIMLFRTGRRSQNIRDALFVLLLVGMTAEAIRSLGVTLLVAGVALFVETAFVGFTLLLPNWLSAVLLLGALIGIRKQVSEEEIYLLRAYGDEYRAYARRVGRFFPWIGRLRE